MRAVRPGASDHAPRPRLVSIDLTVDEDVVTSVTSVSERLGSAAKVPDRAALIRLDGPSAGQAIVLTELTTRVGRGREADLRVEDDGGVSRLHAEIHRQGTTYVLVDLGSRNGSSVQGDRVMRRTLRDGDVVVFGARASFRFSLLDCEQEALFKQLYESSIRDVLTGAYNRQHFNERLAAEIAYAVRHQGDVSLVLFDIDHFKKVNDSHGHPAGDAVLKHVSAVISARLRAEDVFARYGGEEFVVILRGVDLGGAARAAERLRGAVAGTSPRFEQTLIPVTISVGCAALSCCTERGADELVAIADRRMYRA
jgi:diguanylate cyclase (GGDEF)-like protein